MSNNNLNTVDERIAVVETTSRNIIIIDPNKVYDPNNHNLVDRYVKQENFVLYTNLRIIKKPSSSVVYNINDNTSSVFNENELIINMLNPIESISKDNTIKYKNDLTIDYTDYFTTNSLNNANSKNIDNGGGLKNFFDPETFGITSISISQNASFKPMVTIEFTDVQGKTLFESGDHPNNPYNFFYSFPYPTFILSIKGFYGKTIDYPLVLTKTVTKFDPESGSYKITAEFLSRTFSIYNSFLLIYAYIAPFMFKTDDMSYLGQNILNQIYDQQNKFYQEKYANDFDSLKRYTFQSGIYPRLLDIQTIKRKLKNSLDDQETSANKLLISELDSTSINIKDRYEYILEAGATPNQDQDLLLNNLEQINLSLKNISGTEIFTSITRVLQVNNNRFYNDSEKSLKPNIIERNNLNEFKRIITNILDIIDTFKTTINEKILNKQLINLTDQIGYMPNAYNISRIIFNNIQAFLILMNIAYKKSLDQIKTNKDDLGKERRTFQDLFGEYTKTESGNKNYEPFPNYYIKDVKQKNNDKTYRKTYPGYHPENKGWAEVLFINEIYDAIDRVESSINPSKKDVDATKETFILNNFDIKKDSIDAYNNTNGYITVLTNMIERFQLYNVYSGNVFKSINPDDLNTIIKPMVDSEYDYFSHLVLNTLDNSKQISYLNDLLTLLDGQRPYETVVGTYSKSLKPDELESLKTALSDDIIKTKGKNVSTILKKYKVNNSVISKLVTNESQLYDQINEIKTTPIFLFDENLILENYFLTETVPSYFSDASDKLKKLTSKLNKTSNTYLFGDRFNQTIISGATQPSPIVINPFKYEAVIKNYGTDIKTHTLNISDPETLKALIGFDPTASTLTTNNSVKNNY
jgi:hypothetical protein